jgi:hypothetical protein
MVWLFLLTIVCIGAFYVKTRRQRKAKQTTYVPN